MLLIVLLLIGLFIIGTLFLVKGHLEAIRFNRSTPALVIGGMSKDLRPYRIFRCIWLLALLFIIFLAWNYKNRATNTISQDVGSNSITILKDERCPEENQHWENNGCYPNTKSISVENGSGEEHRLGTGWSIGIIIGCDAGYVTLEGACVELSTLPDEIKVNLIKRLNIDLPDNCVWGKVDRVVDGDTIVVGGKKVRLIGIDTPESVDPRKPVEPYAIEASNRMKQLVGGKEVCLTVDNKSDNEDKYNRLLRYIYLSDGTFINAELVKEGYAQAYVIFPFYFKEWFQQLEATAQQQKLGLWGNR